jgi:hypothetical protein
VRNDTSGAGNALIWKLEEVTAEGQIKKAQYGNGLTTTYAYQAQTGLIDSIQTGPSGTATVQNFQYDFDQLGNLTMRKDAAQTPNVSEQITGYDPLNRVTSLQRYSGTTAQGPPSTFAYYNNGDAGGQPNALGNLKSKSGVAGVYDRSPPSGVSCLRGSA